MAKKVYDEKIDKNTDWGGDASTGDLPVAGARVQEFLKEQLNGRIGHLHYDETNNRYIAFADEDTKNEYLDDVTKTDLILGTFDAPFNYTASIDLLSPSYVSILNGTKNNYIDFTFDIVNKQGASTGEPVIVTYTFIKSGKKQTVTEQYQPGTQVHFKVDDYISTGTNYVQVAITGQNTLAATTRSVTYLVVDLQLTDDLSISKVYSPDSSMVAEIPYSVSGYGTKVMEWYVDGVLLDFVKVEDEILDISTTRTKYIDLSELSHGRHSIQFRTYVVIDGDNFYSDTLYRDVIVNRGLSTDPIIAIATVIPTGYPLITTGNVVLYGMTQYVPYTISFAVYAPGNTSSVLTQVYLDGSTIANIDAQNGRVNTLGLRVSSCGNKVLQLTAGDTTYDVTASIARSTISIEEINSGLTLALQAIGRSNADTNKDEWVYGLINTTFTGFEWNGQSGWNNSRLLINKGAYIDMNVAPFASDVTNTGATFEFEFETSNVTDDDAAIWY